MESKGNQELLETNVLLVQLISGWHEPNSEQN